MAKKKEKIKFLKIRDVKSPERGNPTDAGIDFFVPKFNSKFIKDLIEKNPQIFGKKDDNLTVSGTISVDVSGTTAQGNWKNSSSNLTINDDTNRIVYHSDKGDKYDDIFKFDPEKGQNYFLLHSHQRVNIPSGIKSRMANGDRALIGGNKSGVSTKHGLIFGAHIIDYEYQGEIHINVINTSTSPVRIYEDMKLIQFVETPIFTSEIEVSEDLDNFYDGHKSSRGEGGFGSTDKIQK
jgi:dUTPase